MIISNKHHFIFIKTRKTASTSIQAALASVCGPSDIIAGGRREISQNCWNTWYEYVFLRAKAIRHHRLFWPIQRFHSRHASIEVVSKVMGERFTTYFKFAFVRNPFDLVVSRYYWDRSQNRHTYNDFALWLSECYAQQRLWEKDLLNRYTHIDGICQLDYVGRFEKLQDDFRYVCNAIGIDHSELPEKKSGFRPTQRYQDHYSPETRSLVAQLFADDLRLFGYSFEEK